MATMTDADGRQVQAFHQIDEGTGQILSVPTPVIGRNLQYFCDYFELSNAELNCLQNGEPLTLVDEGSMTCMTLPASASVSGMNANGVNRTRRG